MGEDLRDRALGQFVLDAEVPDLVLDARQRAHDHGVGPAANQRVVELAALDRGRDAGLHGAADQVLLQAVDDAVGEGRVLRQGLVEAGKTGQFNAEPGDDHGGREGFERGAGAELSQRRAEIASMVDQRHRGLGGERLEPSGEGGLHRGVGDAEAARDGGGEVGEGGAGDRDGDQRHQRRPGLGQAFGLVVPLLERRIDGGPVDVGVVAELVDPGKARRLRKPVERGAERAGLAVFDDEARAGPDAQAGGALSPGRVCRQGGLHDGWAGGGTALSPRNAGVCGYVTSWSVSWKNAPKPGRGASGRLRLAGRRF